MALLRLSKRHDRTKPGEASKMILSMKMKADESLILHVMRPSKRFYGLQQGLMPAQWRTRPSRKCRPPSRH